MGKIQLKNREVEVQSSISEISIDKLEKCINEFQSNNIVVDRYINLLTILTNLSEDEIGDLDLEDFQTLVNEINTEEFWKDDIGFINEFELNGIKYKSKSDGKSYSFNVKEILTAQNKLKDKKDGYIIEIAAIVFKEVDEDGKIINDLSEEAIQRRKENLKDLSINIIIPYILTLTKIFNNAQ